VTPLYIVSLVAIGFLSGTSNALVGGGTLFSFPVLIALGIPPVTAVTTNMAALFPGTVTSAYACYPQTKPVRATLPPRIFAVFAGGLLGAILLLLSGDALFATLVPWLLAGATILFAFSKPFVRYVLRASPDHRNPKALPAMEFFCAVYGGYFGAGIGILMLAAMALAGEHNMQSANAQRNFLVCFIQGTAVAIFIASGTVDWPVALIVMIGSITGGYSGARMLHYIPNEWLRHIITAAGAIFSVIYFLRVYG
jgi:uncharacterized membrane protein YfcA